MKRGKTKRTEWLQLRISSHENKKLRAFAKRHDSTISNVIRQYIRRLPNAHEEDSEEFADVQVERENTQKVSPNWGKQKDETAESLPLRF